MKLDSAKRRVASLENRLAPKPPLMPVSGAKERLLERIARHTPEEQERIARVILQKVGKL